MSTCGYASKKSSYLDLNPCNRIRIKKSHIGPFRHWGKFSQYLIPCTCCPAWSFSLALHSRTSPVPMHLFCLIALKECNIFSPLGTSEIGITSHCFLFSCVTTPSSIALWNCILSGCLMVWWKFIVYPTWFASAIAMSILSRILVGSTYRISF